MSVYLDHPLVQCSVWSPPTSVFLAGRTDISSQSKPVWNKTTSIDVHVNLIFKDPCKSVLEYMHISKSYLKIRSSTSVSVAPMLLSRRLTDWMATTSPCSDSSPLEPRDRLRCSYTNKQFLRSITNNYITCLFTVWCSYLSKVSFAMYLSFNISILFIAW